MQIIRQIDTPSEELGRERRWYYQTEQLRVVITKIPAGHVQNEHRHEKMYDATYILEGEVEVSERIDGQVRHETAKAGDFVVFAPGPYHNIANQSGSEAVMLTLKFVRDPDLEAESFRALCKTDWLPREPDQR